MNPSGGNPGLNKLALTLQGRMNSSSSAEPFLDFGTILNNYSLQANRFPIPIPSSDYLVCRSLAIGKAGSVLTTTTGGDHSHNVLVPNKMRSLSPNDRVLIAWVDNDAVVIDIIIPANQIGG